VIVGADDDGRLPLGRDQFHVGWGLGNFPGGLRLVARPRRFVLFDGSWTSGILAHQRLAACTTGTALSRVLA